MFTLLPDHRQVVTFMLFSVIRCIYQCPCAAHLESKRTTYATMIYTALCIMFWMGAYPLLGQVGGGQALEFSSFLGPKNSTRLLDDAISQGPKNSRIPGPNTAPTYPRNGYARIQNIMHGAV
jgi:hypothetical protein